MTITELVKKNYLEKGYNCSETILHSGNEYYGLGLHEEDMRMLSGFGSGMYSGSTCGALVGSVAVLSKLIVKTKAHDHLDELRPIISSCCRNFRAAFEAQDCKDIRPRFHSKETRCLNTCLLAAEVLEKTASSYGFLPAEAEEA